MTSLQLVGAFHDKEAARDLANSTGAVLLESGKADTAHLPFASLVMAVSDDLPDFETRADVGTYLVCERPVKGGSLTALRADQFPGSVGIFTMVANPALGHQGADAHWRDEHAPLALRVHTAMTHYYQLSVLHRFNGPDWNGFALCCFANEDDLRHRFFNSAEGEQQVAEDVARFADTRRSPRRVIATARRAS